MIEFKSKRKKLKWVDQRRKKMNNHEYNKALRLRAEYESVKKKFEQNSGIIQPIRAVVIRLSDCAVKEGTNASLGVYGSKIAEIMSSCRIKHETDFTKEAIAEFNKQSQHVGYITAVHGENPHTIKYGISYCNDVDYQNFNNDFGKLLAMKRALSSGIELDELVRDMDFVNFTKGSKYVYIWPFTYSEQINHFIKRVSGYFK